MAGTIEEGRGIERDKEANPGRRKETDGDRRETRKRQEGDEKETG